MSQQDNLETRLVSAFRRFLEICGEGGDISHAITDWEALNQEVIHCHAQGVLTQKLAMTAESVTRNVAVIAEQLCALEMSHQKQLKKVSQDLDRMVGSDDAPTATSQRKRPLGASDPSSPPASALIAEEAMRYRSARLDSRSPELEIPHKPTDHIREWFLQHLANPYPSAVEKDSLSELSGIPRSKIDSDMTNWRRRAGWTDIKDNWANGSRDAMRHLIEKIESGQEKRKGVREAVEKMKAYLERREEERVGDWIKELTALAKPVAKKARLTEEEQHVEDNYIKSETLREATPPLTQHVPAGSLSTMSSISSLATATSAMRTDISPAVSLRSASSSSMSSTSSVLSKDFEFKPYQYNGTMSNGYGLNGGTKRELPAEMATSAEREQRFKHSTQAYSSQSELPQWVTDPNYGGRQAPPAYFAQEYPPQQMGFHVGHAGPSSYPIYPQPQQVMYSYAPPTQYSHLGQGHPQHSPQGQPTGHGDSGGMWSSNAPMPLLPHMQVHQANTWQMPQQWEFRPPVGQWSQ